MCDAKPQYRFAGDVSLTLDMTVLGTTFQTGIQ
jgi:hypothetical protein